MRSSHSELGLPVEKRARAGVTRFYVLFSVFSVPTSSPGPSPRSKWWSEKPWSILSRGTWWNGFFGDCFQRLAALFVFRNQKPLFKQNEDISSFLRDGILTNFWSYFVSPGQGFLRPPFWTRRRPWGRGWPPCLPYYQRAWNRLKLFRLADKANNGRTSNINSQSHSRPQRPRSLWSAPRIETSGRGQGNAQAQ